MQKTGAGDGFQGLWDPCPLLIWGVNASPVEPQLEGASHPVQSQPEICSDFSGFFRCFFYLECLDHLRACTGGGSPLLYGISDHSRINLASISAITLATPSSPAGICCSSRARWRTLGLSAMAPMLIGRADQRRKGHHRRVREQPTVAAFPGSWPW